MMENGHPGVEIDEAAIRKGENPYTKYYQQQGENPLPVNGQVNSSPEPLFRNSANTFSGDPRTPPLSIIDMQQQCYE
jgi:hypothetical protein